MIIQLIESEVLIKSLDVISELVEEVKIKVNDEGLSVIAIDPANVAMIELKINKECFTQFEHNNDILCVNLKDLVKILKRCKKKDTLRIGTKNDNSLDVDISGKINRNFQIALINIEGEDKEMPGLESTTQLTIDINDFINAIEDCSVIGDACTFNSSSDKFTIESKNLNSAKIIFSDVVNLKNNDISKYSIEYLQKFLKASTLVDDVKIKFSKDAPLELTFKNDTMELNFVLAPRVED